MDPTRRRATFLLLAAVLAVGLGVAVLTGTGDHRADTSATGDGSPSTSTSAPGPGERSAPSSSSTVPSSAAERRGSEDLGNGQAITIAFAGDMNFEGTLRNRLDTDPSGAVGPFAPLLRGADLAVGNLETSITTGGTRATKQFAFRAPPQAVGALRAAGFDVVSMANNHGLDYGPDGLRDTLAVQRAQADHFIIGIGGDEDEAFAPFHAVVKGQRVAVIGATQVLDSSLTAAWTATATQGGLASAKRVTRLVEEVRRARADSDTVVVFLHWGTEKTTCPNGEQQALAKTLAAAGADLIVGGHAHRVQGAGRLGSALVDYGLGNFLFRANSEDGAHTGVLEVTVTGRRVDAYRWHPGRIAGNVPQPLSGAAATAEAGRWDRLRSCTGLTP